MKVKIFIILTMFIYKTNSFSSVNHEKNKVLNNIKVKTNNKPLYFNISEAINYYKVPAISMALINDNKIEWTYTYGYTSKTHKQKINNDTLFRFGSISKPVAALVALKLVDKGVLSLDKDINKTLTSWKIEIPSKYKGDIITLRSLLSMSSGLNVSGFYGYSPYEKIPNLIEILNGKFPANNSPIKLEYKPGFKYNYSGGSYEVLELLVQNSEKNTFSDVAKKELFIPLNLENTFFSASLDKNLKNNVAQSFDKHGQPFPYPWRISPELASAGLWSTPSDIAKILIEVMNAYQNEKSIFSFSLIKEPLTQQKNTPYGFGFVSLGKNKELQIAKLGQNAGYQGWLIAYPEVGKGAVIITNSDNGRELAQDIIYSMANAYHWPTNGKMLDAWMLSEKQIQNSDKKQ